MGLLLFLRRWLWPGRGQLLELATAHCKRTSCIEITGSTACNVMTNTHYQEVIANRKFRKQDSDSEFQSGSRVLKKDATHNSKNARTLFFQVCCFRTRIRSLFTLVTKCLTDWLTNSMACEDTNSKLVEVVTVADVDAEDHVGNSLLQIWELTFGSKAKLLFRLLSKRLVKILKLKFRQDFEAGVFSAFCRWFFVEVLKLNLGWDSETRLSQDFEF